MSVHPEIHANAGRATVKARLHVGPDTWATGYIRDVYRAGYDTWDLPGLGYELLRLRFSGGDNVQALATDQQLMYEFDWVDSPLWTVEEWLFNNRVFRLEYKTIYPNLPKPTVPPADLALVLSLINEAEDTLGRTDYGPETLRSEAEVILARAKRELTLAILKGQSV